MGTMIIIYDDVNIHYLLLGIKSLIPINPLTFEDFLQKASHDKAHYYNNATRDSLSNFKTFW